jgi:carboxyl-terminal processing protease
VTEIKPRKPYLAEGKAIVVLADGGSASASEMFIGALSDNNRAKIVGETTYGKGIGQARYPLPDGAELHVTAVRLALIRPVFIYIRKTTVF